jgi:hypothetical protein
MAKKKVANKGTRKPANKSAKSAAKPAASRKPKKPSKSALRAAAKTKAAKAMARLLAAAVVGTKHKNMRLGLQKKNGNSTTPPLIFELGKANTFTVYGDSIGSANPHSNAHPKKVKLKASAHKWDPVNSDTDLVDIDDNTLQITATPKKMKTPFWGTDDDLTVTISVDDGTPGCDTTECYFPDIQYDG